MQAPNQEVDQAGLGPTIEYNFTTTKGGSAYFYKRYHGTEPPSNTIGAPGDIFLVDVPGRRRLFMKTLDGTWVQWLGVTKRSELLMLHPLHPDVCLTMNPGLTRVHYYQPSTFKAGRHDELGPENSQGYIMEPMVALDTLRSKEGQLQPYATKWRRNFTAAIRKPFKSEVSLIPIFVTYSNLSRTRMKMKERGQALPKAR